jgi:hypothetical protein
MDRIIKEKLDKIFYGEEFLSRGFQKFYEEVKRRKVNVGQELTRFYYDNQQVVQMFKPKGKFQGGKIITLKPFRKVYIDTMFITDSNITLINIVDLFTKYALIKVFKGGSTDSKKATEAIKAYINDVMDRGYFIGNVLSDNGSEFKGEFSKYLSDNDINHVYLDVNDKKQTSPIESFNKTVRLMYEKYKAIYGNDITQIFNTIKQINRAYNNSVHSSTKFTPLEMVEDKDKQEAFIKKNKEIREEQKIKDEINIQVGDYVRLPIEKGAFDKLGANWTKDYFKVTRFYENKRRFKVEGIDKLYAPYELQVVDVENLMGRKLAIKPNQKLPNELINVITSFIKEKEKKEEPKPIEKRVTRGNRVDYKELLGMRTRANKKS